MVESSRLPTATEIVQDLQTEIKILIRDSVFRAGEMQRFMERAERIVEKGVLEIEDDRFRQTARESLLSFAKDQFTESVRLLDLGSLPLVVAFMDKSMVDMLDLRELTQQFKKKVAALNRTKINQAFSNLGNSHPKVGRQGIYGYSEMVERRKAQKEMVRDLKAKTNLVVCDSHSDCSDRCAPWQGRVYSLDKKIGQTTDGRRYVPLEFATYTRDRYGNKNGLLGYNCRHKLTPYEDGKESPKVSQAERVREYQITKQQRLLEREVRRLKDLAAAFKAETGIREIDAKNKKKASFYAERARMLASEYREFCQRNRRTEYRSRLVV